MKDRFLFRGFALWSAFVATLPILVAGLFVLDGHSASFALGFESAINGAIAVSAGLGFLCFMLFSLFSSPHQHRIVMIGLLFAAASALYYGLLASASAENSVIVGSLATVALSLLFSILFDSLAQKSAFGSLNWKGFQFFGLGFSTTYFASLGINVFHSISAAFLLTAVGAAVAMYFYGKVLDEDVPVLEIKFGNATL